MSSSFPIISFARQVLREESEALQTTAEQIDASFEAAVRLILRSQGRFVLSGIGKSALIAQKIVATLNSTGTAALFMHAADAIHGDLGLIQPGDTAMIISKSGESPEIKTLMPIIRQRQIPLIALVGNLRSALAQNADIVLDTTIRQEACPHNLAPTTSTTVQLALGDALALTLMQLRHFTPQDFARHHPGGFLGKSLSLQVKDLLHPESLPQISPQDRLKNIILSITRHRVGATVVVERQKIVGIITDGDIRRTLEQYDTQLQDIFAAQIMSTHPKMLPETTPAAEALQQMQQHNISQMIVTNAEGTYKGIIHLHDLLKEGFTLTPNEK